MAGATTTSLRSYFNAMTIVAVALAAGLTLGRIGLNPQEVASSLSQQQCATLMLVCTAGLVVCPATLIVTAGVVLARWSCPSRVLASIVLAAFALASPAVCFALGRQCAMQLGG